MRARIKLEKQSIRLSEIVDAHEVGIGLFDIRQKDTDAVDGRIIIRSEMYGFDDRA